MIRTLLILSMFLAFSMHTYAYAREAVPIADMKAAYLYNFILYAKWPSNPQLVNLCLYKQAHASINVNLLETKRNQQIKLTLLKEIKNASECQVIYVDEANGSDLPALNAVLANSATLVITNAAIPFAQSSMIQLNVEHDFLTFTVNLKAIRLANIQLSAKILQLAKQVDTE